jgi:hypothetical protein
LKQLTERNFDEPVKDAYEVARSVLSAGTFNPADLDDQLAYISRYLRQSWEYLETLEYSRLNDMSAAATRLVLLENGKGPKTPLDPRPASEENR